MKKYTIGLSPAFVFLLLGGILVVVPSRSFADTCKGPNAEKQADLSTYVMKKYHFDPAGQIALIDSKQASDSCYWMLHYRVSSPKRDLTVYLSPDGDFLVTSLFDLRIDPAIEERANASRLAKALLAGTPPSLGSSDAPVTIIEFSDFQCPYCKRMADVLEKELSAEERKDVRVIFRHFPLPMHPWAEGAAEASECAAIQSDPGFWIVHDYLFENQKTLTPENVQENVMNFAVANAGIDRAQFQQCLTRKFAVGHIAQDMDLAKANSVRATPTLFINGTRYEGMKDVAALRAIIATIKKQQIAVAGSTDAAK